MIMVYSIFNFMLSSIFMTLCNKLLMSYSIFSGSFLIVFQNIFCLLALKIKYYNDLELEFDIMNHWWPCSFLFSCSIFSSMFALKYISIPTLIVLRNAQPILSFCFDLIKDNYGAKNEKNQNHMKINNFALIVYIFLGFSIYCYNDLEFNTYGYLWACIHVFFSTLNSIYIKHKIKITKEIVFLDQKSDTYEKEMSIVEMSFYNNMLSIPFILYFWIIEYQIANMNSVNHASSLSYWFIKPIFNCFNDKNNPLPICPLSVTFSFIGSLWISLSGLCLQKSMDTVSWQITNNIVKIPSIFMSSLFFNITFQPYQVVGLILSLCSAFLYHLCNQKTWPIKNKVLYASHGFIIFTLYVIALHIINDNLKYL